MGRGSRTRPFCIGVFFFALLGGACLWSATLGADGDRGVLAAALADGADGDRGVLAAALADGVDGERGVLAAALADGADGDRGVSEPVRAVRGLLDLRGAVHPLEDDVPLAGEWEFYWERFVSPGGPPDWAVDGEPIYLSVPGGWKRAAVDGAPLPGQGYGTYRLRVLLPAGGAEAVSAGSLALYMPYVRTSHRVFVNGEPVASQGGVGVGRSTAMPAPGPMLASIPGPGSGAGLGPGPDVLDIVVHVSNFSFRAGGMGRTPVLGEEQALRRFARRAIAFEVLLAAILLVVGVYHIGMWVIRPQERHVLFFGLFSLAVALRNFAMDEMPLTALFPNISWEWLLKIEYIGYYTAVPLIILFLQHMYPEEYDARLVGAAAVVGGLFSVFVLVTPGRVHSYALPVFQALTVPALLLMVHGLLGAYRRRRAGAKVILTAGVVASGVVLHDILYFLGMLNSRGLLPLSVPGLVAAYSFVLSKKFSDEFEHQRRLRQENEELLRMVNDQIIQIKNSRRFMNERDERTRRDVAEMLHGSVQSRLLSAQHHLRKSLERLTPLQRVSAARAELEDVVDGLHRAREQIAAVNEEEIRQLSHLLHPMLLRLGLVPALQSLAQRFSDQIQIEVIADWDSHRAGPATEPAIPESVRLAMYRIVEEAVTNAVKHAGAARVVIELAVSEEGGRTLVGVVRDDGVGMDPKTREEVGRGFGMQMIAARVEELEGAWSVDSREGKGTAVRASLPLPDVSSGGGTAGDMAFT